MNKGLIAVGPIDQYTGDQMCYLEFYGRSVILVNSKFQQTKQVELLCVAKVGNTQKGFILTGKVF